MERTFHYEILPQIKTRWSSRALSEEKVSRDDILAMVEAARYAPSCYNEQPWRFVIADTTEALEKMRTSLTESNKIWAGKVPVLIAICSKKSFSNNGNENYWHQFDTGTAWGYMSLEAERRGLVAHGMGGFDREVLRKVIGLPHEYDPMALVAVGKPGDRKKLPEDLQVRDTPGTRKELAAIAFFETFAHK
jgi:nitroreductase